MCRRARLRRLRASRRRSLHDMSSLAGDDALAACGTRDDHRPEVFKRPARLDLELVHGAFPAALDVEEVPGRGTIDGAGVGFGVAQQRELAAPACLEAGQRRAAGVRGVVVPRCRGDPAGGSLVGLDGVELGERAVLVELEARQRTGGLGDQQVALRVEGNAERDRFVGVDDRVAREASPRVDREDLDGLPGGLGRDDQLRAAR